MVAHSRHRGCIPALTEPADLAKQARRQLHRRREHYADLALRGAECPPPYPFRASLERDPVEGLNFYEEMAWLYGSCPARLHSFNHYRLEALPLYMLASEARVAQGLSSDRPQLDRLLRQPDVWTRLCIRAQAARLDLLCHRLQRPYASHYGVPSDLRPCVSTAPDGCAHPDAILRQLYCRAEWGATNVEPLERGVAAMENVFGPHAAVAALLVMWAAEEQAVPGSLRNTQRELEPYLDSPHGPALPAPAVLPAELKWSPEAERLVREAFASPRLGGQPERAGAFAGLAHQALAEPGQLRDALCVGRDGRLRCRSCLPGDLTRPAA
jgi:hypothetical protein